MHKFLATLMVASTLLMSCYDDADSPDDKPSARNKACDPALDRAFTKWEAAGFSGSVAISTGGKFDCLAGYGLADEAAGTRNTTETVFSIGSITKSFTAASIFQLVDDGVLSLTDRAGDLVPDLVGPAADATVKQLLVHTSGLTGSHGSDHEPLTRDAAVTAIGGLESEFEPGSDFLYSNSGYTLLALIVEATSGTSYRDFTAGRTLPLPDGSVAGGFWDGDPPAPGPRAVGYLDDGPTDVMGTFAGPHWAVDGNGGLAMTTRDLARWTRALFAGEVASPASAEVIGTPGFDNGDGTAETPGWAALGDAAFGEPVFMAAGGGGDIGHNAIVAWLPDSDRVVAMASNTPDVSAEELLQAVGPALLEGDDLPTPEAGGDEVDPAVLDALVGTYELGTGGTFDVVAGDGGLEIAATGSDAVAALFPLPGSGRFTTGDVEIHEEHVLALIAGETQEGREERDAFESEFGPIDEVTVEGTIVREGELRTYLILDSGSTSVRMWFAVDDEGGIAAVEITDDPATLPFIPAGDGFRPDDPTGQGPDVTVAFDESGMTVTGPTGRNFARPAP